MTWLQILGLLACSTHHNHIDVASETFGARDIRVAEPVFLVDLVEGDPFRTNTIVGNVTFSGGYVTESTPDGLFNVSKEVSVSNDEKYRRQVTDWLADVLGPPDTSIDELAPPERRERRGTSPRDGRDNVSLPRVELQPVPAGHELESPTLVPWVVSYLSHNAGWFFGQEYGSGGGARIRILLVAYDTDGSVLGYRDVDGSRISERVFSPTGPQMQDFLIALERRVGRKL